jgi:hypothetical protein
MMTIVRQIQPDEWEVLRAVRLAALRDAPTAFSETLAEAEAMPADFWQGRAERGAKVLYAGVLEANARATAFYQNVGFVPHLGVVPDHPTTHGSELVLSKELQPPK